MIKCNKLTLLTLLGLAVVAFCVFPIPLPGQAGGYNTISRLYWCANPSACVHERGHALDQSLGWPSQSGQFAYDLRVYEIRQMRSDNPEMMAGVILQSWTLPVYMPGLNLAAETYAMIYEAANGDLKQIPDSLRKYYGANQ